MAFIAAFVRDVLSVPAVLVGIAALVGLIALKKTPSEILVGTFKATMGFLILIAGAITIIGTLNNLAPMLQEGFGIHGVVPNNEAIVAVAQTVLGPETALIMIFGFVANILYARFTPFKYIFLTGHHTFFMACLLSAVLGTAGLSGPVLVIVGSLILGALMVLMPAWAHPVMRKITGGDDIALGHFGTLGYMASAYVGRLVGKPEDSIEKVELPKGLGFLRDSLVATALAMVIIFIIAAVAAGPAFTEEKSGGQNFIVFAIMQGLTFAGGVAIIIAGVRMILAEIVPAFKGIAEKIVPEAKPALDCPVVFPYAPTAVLVGFLSSFVAGIVGMFLLGPLGLTIIIPGLVPHFFCGATAGVFGNTTGGKRGAVIGAFVHGLIISFLPALLLPVLGALGFENTTFGDADFGWVGIVLGYLARLIKGG